LHAHVEEADFLIEFTNICEAICNDAEPLCDGTCPCDEEVVDDEEEEGSDSEEGDEDDEEEGSDSEEGEEDDEEEGSDSEEDEEGMRARFRFSLDMHSSIIARSFSANRA